MSTSCSWHQVSTVPSFSLFDPRHVRSAIYFKTLEGFLEAAPQLALQLALVFRGHWTQSSRKDGQSIQWVYQESGWELSKGLFDGWTVGWCLVLMLFLVVDQKRIFVSLPKAERGHRKEIPFCRNAERTERGYFCRKDLFLQKHTLSAKFLIMILAESPPKCLQK